MDYSIARRRMVESQIIARGISDQRVLDALLKVPRHLFVDEALRGHAYSDGSLPIGEKQTISQPYIVAAMTAALNLTGNERILEIGVGSGYQTAVLSHLVRRVYGIERISALAMRARRTLDQCGVTNVNLKVGDGTLGWKEQAPFDGILVAAGAPVVPEDYLEQLVAGGYLVMPVGDRENQTLVRVTKHDDGRIEEEQLMGCRFVPLIGEQGWTDGVGCL
ncbi:MAG TPA: protein-L-isoaspartate(D-aspartate) O-methyltransferase [Geopsychrobacteraceae bacterium]|nr:protein-L-isoaspartate(D-aspartate) O-methyltransferase [Geopsychrobacteraceae bacterium]